MKKNFKLSEFNKELSSNKLMLQLVSVVFCMALFLYIYTVRSYINAPPFPGDGPDYEAIGLQISRGQGFSFDFSDETYRTPYLQNNEDGKYNYLVERSGMGITAYRPPLFPALISFSYLSFGRQFWVVRVLNSAFMALACAIGFIIAYKRFGVLPGIIYCMLFLFFDRRPYYYAGMFLTEALASFFVALIFLLILNLSEKNAGKNIFILGGVTGMAFLARSIFFMWVPFVLVIIQLFVKFSRDRRLKFSAMRLSSLFVLSFVLVSGPWMLRNCIVLKSINPLGTMGAIELSAAYSDGALSRRGYWTKLEDEGFFAELDFSGRSLFEKERMKANYSREKAVKWASENLHKLPLLAYYKMEGLWKPKSIYDGLLLSFALLGLIALISYRPRDALFSFVLIFGYALSIAASWIVGGGRFLVPLLPILTVLAAFGVWCVSISVFELAVERISDERE